MRILTLFAALVLLSGCAFHVSRGTLSQAMEESAGGTGGKQRKPPDSSADYSDGLMKSFIGAMFSRESDSYDVSASASASRMDDFGHFALKAGLKVSF